MSIANGNKLMDLNDGQVIYNDLSDRIVRRAPGIRDTLTNYSHGLTDSIIFVGNAQAWGNARYANAKNLIRSNSTGSLTLQTVVITKYKNIVVLNGTASGGDDTAFYTDDTVDIPAGTYTFKIEPYVGEGTTLGGTKNIYVDFWYDGNETTTRDVRGSVSLGTSAVSASVTLTNHVYKIRVWVGVRSGAVYSDYRAFYSLLPSTAAITDTQQTVSATGTLVYNLPSEMREVDTLMHESTATEIANTKDYVDKIGTDLKNISQFVTPEQFGAKGNGSANDTDALNACLAYAIANSVPVFGAKTYKVTSPIAIDCDDMTIYIHRINSSASIACALSLTGSRNNLIVDRIYTTNSVGFRMLSSPTRTTQNNYFKSQIIYASGNAIEVYGVAENNTDATLISYNTFMLNKVQSANGHCIVNGNYCAENQYYNAECVAPNGWGLYTPRAARCYGFSFEESLYGGIYMTGGSSGSFAGFRHTELTDKIVYRMMGETGYTGGTLIKIVGPYQQGFTYVASHYVPYQAIDTSEMTDYTDPDIDEMDPREWYAPWFRYNLSTRSSQILGEVKYGSFRYQNGGVILGNSMTIVAGKKICQPVMDTAFTVTENIDMRDNYTSDDDCYPWASTFIIDVADCEIHLPPSYCCLGYKEFTVDQSTSGKLCTIYNSYDPDVPIFDGSTLGAGVYTLKCSCDLSMAATQIPTTANYYTGRNDLWEVRDSTGAVVSTYRYTTPPASEE